MLLAFKCPNGQIEPAYTARGVTDQWRSAGGSAHIVTRLERFTPQRLSGWHQACICSSLWYNVCQPNHLRTAEGDRMLMASVLLLFGLTASGVQTVCD